MHVHVDTQKTLACSMLAQHLILTSKHPWGSTHTVGKFCCGAAGQLALPVLCAEAAPN